MTRYVFLGAGAIGSALGGLLAMSGTDVLLVARGEHARVMAARGVHLRCPDLDTTVPVPTITTPDEAHLTVDDVLVLSTKTHQAEAALGQWADVDVHDPAGSVVGRAADVLPLFTALNGVTSEEIALRYFARVFAVCVWSPVVMISPGEVIVRGAPLRGVFHVGRFGASLDPTTDAALLDRVARDWDAAGARIVRPDAVMAWKYRKLLANVGNVLEALVGDASGAEDVRQAAEVEARETLAAAGIAVTGDEESRIDWQPPDLSFPPVPGAPALLGGSSWQSLVRGTGTVETDYLNGEIVLVARRIGREAPVNARLTALARRAAREGLPPGSATIEQVRAAVTT